MRFAREERALENGPLAPCTIAFVMNVSAAANVGLAVVVEPSFVDITDDADDEPDPPAKSETMALKIGATSLSTLG
jgi:hypothetical protein